MAGKQLVHRSLARRWKGHGEDRRQDRWVNSNRSFCSGFFMPSLIQERVNCNLVIRRQDLTLRFVPAPSIGRAAPPFPTAGETALPHLTVLFARRQRPVPHTAQPRSVGNGTGGQTRYRPVASFLPFFQSQIGYTGQLLMLSQRMVCNSGALQPHSDLEDSSPGKSRHAFCGSPGRLCNFPCKKIYT